MNFITYVPYCLNNGLLNNSFSVPQPQTKSPSVLECKFIAYLGISEALRISLRKYEKEAALASTPPKETLPPISKPIVTKQSQKITIPAKDEAKQRK
jgi:hypothetical protein